MEKGVLRQTFRNSVLMQRAAFIYSANSAVQLEQNQLATSGTGPTHLEALFDDEDRREQKKRDDDFFEYAALVLEDIQRRALEATRAAEEALNGFESTLDRSRKALASREAESAAHTIVLSDGRAVFYDEAASHLVYQDAASAWHELQDPEALAEARSKALANGGYVATKTAKEATDAWRADIDAGAGFHMEQQEKFTDAKERAGQEDTPSEETIDAMEQIKDDVSAFEARLKHHESALRATTTQIDNAELEQSKAAAVQAGEETTASQTPDSEYAGLFGAPNPGPGKPGPGS